MIVIAFGTFPIVGNHSTPPAFSSLMRLMVLDVPPVKGRTLTVNRLPLGLPFLGMTAPLLGVDQPKLQAPGKSETLFSIRYAFFHMSTLTEKGTRCPIPFFLALMPTFPFPVFFHLSSPSLPHPHLSSLTSPFAPSYRAIFSYPCKTSVEIHASGFDPYPPFLTTPGGGKRTQPPTTLTVGRRIARHLPPPPLLQPAGKPTEGLFF